MVMSLVNVDCILVLQVHHMELFHCEVDHQLKLPAWNGLCNDPQLPEPLKACKRVVAAWAFGAGVSFNLVLKFSSVNFAFLSP